MWIKQVKKTNSPKGKVFYQYQLTETYRIDKAVRHKSILYLGYHPLLENKDNRKKVSKLLESRIRKTPCLSEDFLDASSELIELAEEYYRRYLIKHQEPTNKDEGKKKSAVKKKEVEPDCRQASYDLIDTSSTETFDSREIGAETMSYEILKRLEIKELLERKGWSNKWIDYAMISIISRAVFTSSEHKTEDWIKHNSGILDLFKPERRSITRHHLYKASSMLYELKEELEEQLYNRATDMFDLRDSLLIYDLTNTHFEGRKEGSKIARFGRNKQKRNDCKQVVLAGVINEYGFLKYSRIYEGNVGDPTTLGDIIDQLKGKSDHKENQRHTIVIDAGIATEDNLEMLRKTKQKYVCVSRSNLKNYEAQVKEGLTEIKDKRGNEISLKIFEETGKSDRWMYVKSKRKNKKETSMLEKGLERFEQELETVKKGIEKKGGTKKIEKVWERIGRIKERNRRSHKYYKIDIKSGNGIATGIKWTKNQDVEEQAETGVYFLRTNYEIGDEQEFWQVYNTIREVESTFRCLKTDLKLRPNFHQKDIYMEAHIHLGLLAYHIVSSIRFMLKQQNINYDWRNIVRIMNTQKAESVRQEMPGNKEIIMRICSRPSQKALEIYKALKISSIPFRMKKFVVHH